MKNEISYEDSQFLSYLRSIAIFIIVFGHVGGFWFYKPYSEFLHVSVPIFFFLSGSVSYFSYDRSPSLFHFYCKRIISLLTPYYLISILSLLVYIEVHHNIPSIQIDNLLKWLLIMPSNAIMPFPLGQVWFLHVLVIIMILSPIYFELRKNKKTILISLLFSFTTISVIQLFSNIFPLFNILYFNFYPPFIYSSFFIYGILFITSNNSINKNISFYVLAAISLFTCIFLAYYFNLDIDFIHHISPPNIFYVSGSFFCIFLLLQYRQKIVAIINKYKVTTLILRFFHNHTFSIFLLHTFAIYLSERFLGLVEPQNKDWKYGVTKLCVVLVITCILSIPFTKISNTINTLSTNVLLKNLPYNHNKKLRHKA